MNLKKMLYSVVIYMFLISPVYSFGDVIDQLLAVAASNKAEFKTLTWQRSGNIEHGHHVSIFSKNCSELIQFTKSLSLWASRMPSHELVDDLWVAEWNDDSSPVKYPCICREAGCIMEVTDFIPAFFRHKLKKKMSCNGPNCFNATLIASGYLDIDQFRYSDAEEYKYYLKEYCREVPIEERATGDIVAYGEVPEKPFEHMASYIDKDIVFSKGGPQKVFPFDFENWSEYFSSLKSITQVFRCRKIDHPHRRKSIQSIEKRLTFLNEFGGDYSSSSLSTQLENLKKGVIRIYERHNYSYRDFLALSSLQRSIFMAQKQLIMIQVKVGDVLTYKLISSDLVAEVRRVSSGAIENRAAVEEKAAGASYKVVPKDEVRTGDSVVIIDSLSSGSDLNAGGVYAVIGMD